MIFDTHAHYDDEAFDSDRDSLLEGMSQKGVALIANMSFNQRSSLMTIGFTKKYPFIYGAIGMHPENGAEFTEDFITFLKDNLNCERIVAVGEIGLDYHWPEPSREVQKDLFIRQLKLASQYNKPVVIHSRDAAADTMEIMKEYADTKNGGVIHCFSYHLQIAREYVDMGFFIGVGGVATFKNSKKLSEVIREIPLERIVIETDCPYMSPEPYRGQRNDSSYLKYVVEKIASIKEIPAEEVERITFENALRLYRIDKNHI